MVRDKNGRKMSKSLGNVIDPMEVINGCLLGELLKKIDEGNLPEKEVSEGGAVSVVSLVFVSRCCAALGVRTTWVRVSDVHNRTVNSTYQ